MFIIVNVANANALLVILVILFLVGQLHPVWFAAVPGKGQSLLGTVYSVHHEYASTPHVIALTWGGALGSSRNLRG